MPGSRQNFVSENCWVQENIGIKIFGPKEILCPKNIGSRKSWVNNLYPKLFVSKKFRAPKIFWVQINFETSQTPFFVPSRHPLYTPIRHPPHPPNSSLLYCIKVGFSTRAGVGWVGGWLVPIAESCHFVVQLARLQDFKQGWNSQVWPSVAIILIKRYACSPPCDENWNRKWRRYMNKVLFYI